MILLNVHPYLFLNSNGAFNKHFNSIQKIGNRKLNKSTQVEQQMLEETKLVLVIKNPSSELEMQNNKFVFKLQRGMMVRKKCR